MREGSRPSNAEYVSSILDTIEGPIVLVGHSYGGAVITNANPWAPEERRFTGTLPWTHVAVHPETGVLTQGDESFDPLAFFGLPAGWPGFEDPPFRSMPIDEFFARQKRSE